MAAAAPIALTCGDPSGVGPELAVLAADRLQASDDPRFFWIGDPAHLPATARTALIQDPAEVAALPRGVLPVLPHPFPAPAPHGAPDPRNARAVIAVIERAVALTQSGAASALTTAPINKAALKSGAAFAFPGHTEFLAHLAGGAEVVMMLASPALKVVPATIHIALSEVPTAFTPEVLRATVRITAAGLTRDFGLKSPRIAVAGLNPHAGEGGAMGTEEDAWMRDTIRDLRAEGYALTGPLPSDTMFHPRARKAYDAAICAYHDQALIPIKTLDFDGGVNVTLGLPFIRTSPDHGTAYDIAGKGLALPDSLIAALRLAAQMAQHRITGSY